MTEPLKRLLLQQLDARRDRPQVTILRRSGHPGTVDMTGADILGKATRLLELWREEFGHGALRIVLALPTGEAFLVALIAGLLGDITIIPIAQPRPGAQADRTRHIVKDCDASLLLCSPEHHELFMKTLTVDGTEMLPCPIATLMEDAGCMTVEISGHVKVRSEDCPAPAIIQYTSGSTHLPKGVQLFPDNILANCRLGSDQFGITEETRFINWLPHYHDMGLMGGILYPLLQGGYSVQMSPLDMIRRPAFWLQTISDYRGTMSGGPAFAFAHCLANVSDKQCEALDLSSWETAFCGAEPVPAGLLPAFRDRFAPHGLKPGAVFACYGLAEYTLFAAGEHEPVPPRLLGEAGKSTWPSRLSPATREGLCIVDPETAEPLPDNQQGEIWLRGPSKAGGYVNLADETDSIFNAKVNVPAGGSLPGDGWLRTGDLGIVKDDWLYVTGRIKDTLTANGMKIAAPELEWLAASHHAALNPAAAAAFMADTWSSGTAVLLIEVTSKTSLIEDPEALRREIIQAIRGEWGITMKDVFFLPRGSLERTSSGKIRRSAIAAAYRQGWRPKNQIESGGKSLQSNGLDNAWGEAGRGKYCP